ncbi:aldo/keto reductase [Ramlibacter sp.]|uniref:aldo/keto reductase n=1 Tax=Ramlibacter sp. TaxID=1917967 RepID=UPI003D0EEE4E
MATGMEIGFTAGASSTVPYRPVGRSGLRASALGIGCIPFGGVVDVAGATAIVREALDGGINYFDTSNSYGLGRSESCLGEALAGRRREAVIATKFGQRTGPGPHDVGGSRLAIVRACEDSLRRLRTDYIDLYQLHWPDRETPIDETLRALDDLVSAGKVRYIGGCNLYEWELCEAVMTSRQRGYAEFVSTQDHYNLLYRDIEKRMEPFLLKFGIGLVPYFPLAGGLLAGAYRRDAAPAPGTRQAMNPVTHTWQSPRNFDVQEKLLAFAQARGWTIAQMALAWLISRPAVSTVIAGVDKVEHLRENLKCLDVRFSAADLLEIDRITLVDEDRTMAPVFRPLEPERIHEFDTLQAAKAKGLNRGGFPR